MGLFDEITQLDDSGFSSWGSQPSFQAPDPNSMLDRWTNQQPDFYSLSNQGRSMFDPQTLNPALPANQQMEFGNLYNSYPQQGSWSGVNNTSQQPSWFDSLKNTWSKNSNWLGPAALLGGNAMMPFLNKMLGGRTQAEQQQEAYNNWLAQNRQNATNDQRTENTATDKAYQQALSSRELSPTQQLNIKGMQAQNLLAALQESNKQQAASGFARSTKGLHNTRAAQGIMGSTTNALAQLNPSIYSKANTVSTQSPFPNMNYDTSTMSQVLGNLQAPLQYGAGQTIANLFKTDQQKAMENLLAAYAKKMSA